jgi:hypothetical protein
MKRLALAGFLVLLGLPARAARPASADFLNLPLDVRALGMGEAAQALASGAGAVASNPAAIGGVRSNHVYFTHSFLYAGIGSDYVGYGLTLGRHHLGASFHHVGYGTLQSRNDQGDETGTYGPSDTVYGFTYGTDAAGAELGATVKYVDSKIVESARTVTFDVGGQYRLGEDWLLAASGRDLGGSLRYEAESRPLPARAAVGAGWRAMEHWWLVLDTVLPVYDPAYVAIGSEYELAVKDIGAAAFRLGVNTRTPDLGSFGGLKIGLGLRVKDSVDVDYAFSPAGDLGSTHHLAFGYRFGGADDSEK